MSLLAPSLLAPVVADMAAFTDVDLFERLQACTKDNLDLLEIGVIGFDAAGVVGLYNAFEARYAGLSPERVLGHPLFTVVAPCMNNFMVAQRFADAEASGAYLDAVVDYVLTLRMRPVKVRLRLLSTPGASWRYVVVERRT